jgi:glycosyltransferase involved in cell wall biosynthesis
MKRILFILPNCAGGGAEKVILQLLQNLDRRKFQLVLVLLQNTGEFIVEIPNDVKIIDLKTKRARYSIFKLKRIVRRELPDIILSTLTETNIAICILAFFTNIKAKIIIRESNIVSILITSFIKKSIYKFFIHNADLLVAQSRDMKYDLIKNFAIRTDKIVLINNPVNVDSIQKKSEEEIDVFFENKKLLVAVGRLSPQKGYDLLINTFSKVTDYDYFLVIIGQGSEEKRLKQMVKDLNIENKVIFAGFQDNPYKWIAKADFLISSSRFEGFPNAVIESLACGTPVIANNYKGGINEIINETVGNIIDITDINAFQNCLSKHSSYNRQLIRNHCKAKYSIDIIIKQYEVIFDN